MLLSRLVGAGRTLLNLRAKQLLSEIAVSGGKR
jgi:hypothetical protein